VEDEEEEGDAQQAPEEEGEGEGKEVSEKVVHEIGASSKEGGKGGREEREEMSSDGVLYGTFPTLPSLPPHLPTCAHTPSLQFAMPSNTPRSAQPKKEGSDNDFVLLHTWRGSDSGGQR